MKLVIQRVKDACVMAEGEETGRIGPGFLVLVGIMEGDTEDIWRRRPPTFGSLRTKTTS